MSIYSKINLKPATSDYSKFDLRDEHLTTLDFGQLIPVKCIENFIGDKFNISYNTFSRLAPMVTTTYGDIGIKQIGAFIPYYLVSEDAESFMAGLSHSNGHAVCSRLLLIDSVLRYLLQNAFNYTFETDETRPYVGTFVRSVHGDEYDRIMGIDRADDNVPRNYIIVKQHTAENREVTQLYKFTYKGKYIYKILRCLGYDIPQYIEFDDATSPYSPTHVLSGRPLSALPLLCYAKMYADLILPNSFYSTSELVKMLTSIRSYDSKHVGTDGSLYPEAVSVILDNIQKVYYNSDYFTTAWQSPNSPLSTITVNADAPSVNEYGNSFGQTGTNNLINNNTGNMLIQHSSNNISGFSQTQLNFLSAFDRFVRRNNLVGYREFNAVYARFGIKPSEIRTNYVQILHERTMPLTVGDVTSTAQTDSTLLGAYAGKGFINGNENSIYFEANDFGMYIQMAYLYVKPVYFQGIRKHCLKTNYLDFYQPEFDGVGPEPISKLEINSQYEDKVYGFTERYNDYRFSLSSITGDFSLDNQMFPWHTGKVFGNDMSLSPVAQSNEVLAYGHDQFGNNEYDRVFALQNRESPNDHFYMIWNFNVSAQRKMKNINQALDLGVGDVVLDRNGSV